MRLLTKRRWARIALAVAVTVLVAGWVWLYRPWEAHYLGRPTSYWAGEVQKVDTAPSWLDGKEEPALAYRRAPPWWQRAWDRLHSRESYHYYAPPVLLGDPAAIPVLIELLDYPGASNNSRWAATVGLKRVGREARAAVPALVRMSQGPNRGLRLDARKALLLIDPEAARRSAVPEVERDDP